MVAKASVVLKARAQALVPHLTDREWEFLGQVVAGHTDQEIATELGLDLAGTQQAVAVLIDRLMTHAWDRAQGM